MVERAAATEAAARVAVVMVAEATGVAARVAVARAAATAAGKE